MYLFEVWFFSGYMPRSGTASSYENQPWILIERTDAEAETPIIWPPDVKNWLTGKDPDAGKDWRQEEKGMTEDEMVGWHHRLNGHEFKQAPRVGGRQGSLACSSPCGCKELDMTEQLNWTDGNGNWLQYSCLENCMDRGVWWAVVHGVAESWTQLKQLSAHVWLLSF